ncbi:MAG: DNA polymerase III subunit gamma/tau [Acidobacteria bacterium]|nr:DNA polymerase III subunit gamma/tau [Acidobacteriota bacterium]
MSPPGSLFGAPQTPPPEPSAEVEPAAPDPGSDGPVEPQDAAEEASASDAPVGEPERPAPATPAETAPDGAGAGDYQVLALRYRPQTFSDLVGQEAIARTLQNAIRKSRIWHAFLFAGPRGVGKTTTARILAKALNCAANEGPTPEPCGDCSSCREIAGGYSRDVPEIDGASNNSVEKAREIIETAHYTPSRDRYKIFLVDEVHMLSGGAFNALLKTLEEPPSHVKFIFATTEIHRIPDTILSRCQEFEFRAVTQRVVAERLRHIVDDQGFEVAPEALAQIARFGQGSLRDALSALDQVIAAVDGAVTAADVSEVIGVPDVAICRRAATAIVEADRRAVFEIVEELVSEGRDLKHFVTLLMHYLRDLTVVRAAPDRPDLLEWPQEQERLAEFAGRFSEEDLLRSLDVLTKIEEGLRWSPEPRFHLEMALLRLVELPRLAAFDRLLEQLDRPADRAPAPAAGGSGSPASQPRLPDPPPPTSASAEPEDAGGSRLLDLDPPPIIREYQETFGGTIVSAKALPGEPPPQSEP